MRVIIIDDSRRASQIIRRFLARNLPDVEVTEYDPDQRGRPEASFEWSLYDLLLLGQDLGPAGNGIDWLRELAGTRGFPTTILLTDRPDENVTTEAFRAGVHAVVSKRELTPGSLAKMAREALVRQSECRSVSHRELHGVSDEEIVRAQFAGYERTSASGYRFVRLIGQGAMSRVYLAERAENGQTVVLKILDGQLAKHDETLQRFVREAAIVSEIDSPYVVKIYEQGFTNRDGYIAMEFFARGDLKARVEHGISIEDARLYALHIAYGLDAIHGVGIIHRDLKPANIMFRADGSLALADFGISKRVENTTELTVAGSVIGSPHYLSPEQGQAFAVDHRTDLYSAGVVLYEMLTGGRPFVGDSVSAIIYQHIHTDVPRLPEELEQFQPVIDRLMAKSREERYQSALELAIELRALTVCA
jgi:DNA-binding NarL/FixJ family response regulator